MKYDIRWSTPTTDGVSKTARMLQRKYTPVFAMLDNKPTQLCSAYWTLATTIQSDKLQIFPHTSMAVSHLPDLSFGFRVGVYNQKHSKEKSFIRSSKKMIDGGKFPTFCSNALRFFENKAVEQNWELGYYERHNAYTALAVGDICTYGEYRVAVELSVAKDSCKIFRSSIFV